MKIGTRSSAMALAQTEEIVRQVQAADPLSRPSLVRFKPSGDVDQVSKLDRHGGKGGAFVGEIRAAMMGGELECAMHSLKDMPGDEEAPGLVIAAMLKRDPPEDVMAIKPGLSIEDVTGTKAAGLKIGTNAVRRVAYLKRLFPEAEIIHFRGAADTRLKKLDEGLMQKLPDGGEIGPADALVMARSGLERIGRADRIAHVFSHEEMLPAVGQGIVAVECPTAHWETRARLALIDDQETRTCGEAERQMLWILNGHCNSPIAGHAYLQGATLHLKGAVISLDGMMVIEAEGSGPADRPLELGRQIGFELLDRGGAALISAARLD
ncbi:MAG: hydroxymethylbilane synthase [Pseudomonadota bacterium]